MPRITSTSFITGTGFMKCMPITLSGRVGRCTQPGDRNRRSVGGQDRFRRRDAGPMPRRASVLTSRFSVTASITNAASLSASSSVVLLMRPRIDCFSSAAQPFFIDVTLQTLIDGLQAAFEKLILHVTHHDVIAGARRHLRDAVAHRSRANHSNDFTHYRTTDIPV